MNKPYELINSIIDGEHCLETCKSFLDVNVGDEASKAGRKIALLCFCDDESTCHRLIIGEMLKNRNCDVVFDKTESR